MYMYVKMGVKQLIYSIDRKTKVVIIIYTREVYRQTLNDKATQKGGVYRRV